MKCTGASGMTPCACKSEIMSSTTPRETAEISGIVTPSCDDMTKVVGGTVLSVTAIRGTERGRKSTWRAPKDARFRAIGKRRSVVAARTAADAYIGRRADPATVGASPSPVRGDVEPPFPTRGGEPMAPGPRRAALL